MSATTIDPPSELSPEQLRALLRKPPLWSRRDVQRSAGIALLSTLVVFGRQDRLIPWQQAERLRDSVSGPVELLMLERGNHGCANVTPWHRPYTADWVAEQLHDHHLVTTNAKAGV